MDIHELMDIGLATCQRDRIDVVDLESVDVASEVVEGLVAIVSQLAHNATQWSYENQDRVRIRGAHEADGYSLVIQDGGPEMSDEFLEALNVVLSSGADDLGDGTSTSGVQLVARMSARHGIAVQLEHGHPGVNARVTLPPHLFVGPAPSRAVTPPEVVGPVAKPVMGLTGPIALDTEAFLEIVFGPLRDAAMAPSHEASITTDPEPVTEAPVAPIRVEIPDSRRTTLRTRVPGHNYNEPDQAVSYTRPGEAAVEIKLALADFTRGRRAAFDHSRDELG